MGSKVDAKVVLLGKEYSGKTSLVERFIHGRFNENQPYQNGAHGKGESRSDMILTPIMDHGKKLIVSSPIMNMIVTATMDLEKPFTWSVFETIGAAFGAKKVIVSNKGVTLGIWDTAGSERYEAMSRIYYRGAKAAVVCYDLTERSSFERAKFWVNELKMHEEHCKIYLCGTKYDIIQRDKKLRQVDYHMTTDYADVPENIHGYPHHGGNLEIGAKVFETSSLSCHNVEELFYEVAKDFAADEEIPDGTEPQSLNLENPKSASKTCSICSS